MKWVFFVLKLACKLLFALIILKLIHHNEY